MTTLHDLPDYSPAWDHFTALVARVLATPCAFLVRHDDSGGLRLLSWHGEGAWPGAPALGEFCRQIFAAQPSIFSTTPDDFPMRWGAGVRVMASDGRPLGALCLLGDGPRALSPADYASLTDVAALAARDLEREDASCQLRERHHLLEAVIEGIPDAIYAKDLSGRYTLINAAGAGHIGKTRTEILGRDDAHLFAPQAAAQTRANDLAVLSCDQTQTFADTEVIGDALRTYSSVKRPYRDAHGDVVGLVGVSRDVTERRQAEAALRAARAQMDAILDSLEVGVWSCDPETGHILYCNAAMEEISGLSRQTLQDDPYLWRQIVHPEDRAQRQAEADDFYGKGGGRFEYRILRPDGQTRWLMDRVRLTRDAEGRAVRMDGVTADITDNKRADEALRQAERNYRGIFENAVEGIFQTDPSGHYLCANPALARLYGYDSPEDLIACVCSTATQLYAEPGRYAEFARRMQECGAVVDFESQVSRKNGTTMWISENARAVRDEEGRVLYYEGSVEDITGRKTLEAERERQLAEALERADHDPLTGLLNHRAFHRRLEEEADRAQRAGTPLTVAVLDLDNFKFFNDAYGHAVGDDVLRQVASALGNCCRSYDVLSRFGGDEFAVLMPGAGPAEAADLTERLRAEAERIGYRPPGYNAVIPLGLSVGVAVFPEDGPGRLEALAAADARLRRAKSGEGDERTEQLRARLSRSREGFSMLDALVTAVDNKDRYTRRHSEDVMRYGVETAQTLGLDEAACAHIQVAALLHDVGKIGVPDHILRKPGRLSSEEYQAVQHHPVMGAVIVGAVAGFEGTLDAVRHHHERWDGAGYPAGLSGEQTPLSARILAVADAFSAMTTDRPYRLGMPQERALAILRDGAGTQWDPGCVAAFLRARAEEATGELSPTPA